MACKRLVMTARGAASGLTAGSVEPQTVLHGLRRCRNAARAEHVVGSATAPYAAPERHDAGTPVVAEGVSSMICGPSQRRDRDLSTKCGCHMWWLEEGFGCANRN